MKGCIAVPFSRLFADTVSTHGFDWAFMYYVVRHKMALWEFTFWCNATGVKV